MKNKNNHKQISEKKWLVPKDSKDQKSPQFKYANKVIK